MLKFFSSKKVQIISVVILTFIAYSNIFANDFAIDDGDFIFNWPAIRDFGNLGRILTVESVPEDHAGVYRPVKAVFMMVWKAVFDSRPFGYHLFSMAVHLINTALVFFIVKQIFARGPVSSFPPASARSDLKSDGGGRDHSELRAVGSPSRTATPRSNFLPLVAALLFGLHPIHTEAVTFILASFDTLGITFYLSAFLLYLYANIQGHAVLDKSAGLDMRIKERIDANKKKILKVASVLLAGLAFFTYELAITFPAIIIVYDFCFRRTRMSADVKNRLARINMKLIVGMYWPYWAMLGLYLFIRFSVLNLVSRGEYLAGSFSVTLLVMARAIVKYCQILIWPLNLSIDHEVLPGVFSVIYKGYLNAEYLNSLTIFSPVILVCTLIIAALVIFSLKVRRKWPVVTFGILWFFVTFLPVSYLFPQSSVMAERYVYLASFGFTLIISYLSYLGYLRYGKVVLVVFMVVVAAYGGRTYVRNFDWKDTLTAWTVLARQSPDNPVANYTLAKIYAEKGEEDLAIIYFEKALLTHPTIAEVNFRLGKIYYSRGQFDLAYQYFLKAAKEDNPRYYFQAKKELNKIEYIKSQSQSAKSKNKLVKWVKYKLENRVTFEYLDSWMVTKFEKGASFDALDVSFSIEIIVDEKESGESFESYLLRQPDHFGKLVGEGWANVPNVSRAYVKVLKDEEVDKLEFFLNEKDVVLKILVYPSGSPKMADFDRLLGSVKVN